MDGTDLFFRWLYTETVQFKSATKQITCNSAIGEREREGKEEKGERQRVRWDGVSNSFSNIFFYNLKGLGSKENPVEEYRVKKYVNFNQRFSVNKRTVLHFFLTFGCFIGHGLKATVM